MAVFVRVLRLAMLFFNVYDSYKVLKIPPPSAQNKGRPSLRAMSQRKRDMKGCLAVWIVWSCFITYERFAEAIVSIFIPFYDEFKSLAMLFLIMTRARGAEPIYLHIIRPFLKPYTSTIDQLLDFTHVVGDVVLSLAALPFIYVLQWWQRRFGTEPEGLDTETEASSSPLSPLPSAKDQPLLNRMGTSKSTKAANHTTSKPRQAVAKCSSLNQRKSSQPKALHPPSAHQPTDNLSVPHEQPTTDNTLIDGLPQTEEWRQYPSFPSAYPPTPLTKQIQIVTTAAIHTSSKTYPSISEEPAQQGFRQSLLPPHNNSNPNYAGDLSDDNNSHGVQADENEQIVISVLDVDGVNDLDESMDVEDEYESEDEFNITLRTPDPPLRILTSLGPPAASSNDLSPLSLPTSALTTTGDGSSLCTPSTESSVASEAPVIPPTLAGHKRALQSTSSTNNARLRPSRVAVRGTSVKVARSARSPIKRGTVTQRRQPRLVQTTAALTLEKIGSPEPGNETPSNTISSYDGELASKRRRLLASGDTVQNAEPARRRNMRAASGTTKPTSLQKPLTHRSSMHPRTKTTANLATLSSREISTFQEDSARVSP